MREGRKAFGAEAENTNREIKTAMFSWVLPTHQKVNYRTSFSVKIANQNCSASCELIRNIFNCHSCSLQICEPKWTAAALPGCLWPRLVTRRRRPSRLCTASITNVLCSLWNYPLHSFKCWSFCLTNAIFNYTESSILLWSNGVYYSSKWHQSATIFPRANYSTLRSFRRSGGPRTCDCTQRELSRLANLLRTAEKCHQETLIVMACNGLLTASLTMVTNGAVAQDRYYALVPLDLRHALHRWNGGMEQMLRRASISKSYNKQAEKLGPQPQWQHSVPITQRHI